MPPAEPETAAEPRKKLTIGMATYDDYDGVYFTVQAIRLFHPEVTDETEIIVIDNNPGGPCAKALRALCDWVKGYRYVASGLISGTAVRDYVFREASTDFVLCVDSHVLIEAGRLRQLIDYFEKDSHPGDLLQGPLVMDDMHSCFSHFEPVWRDGIYGVWEVDERAADPENEPFDIPMQGLGLFACRRRDWPGFNPRFSGFGGEEGYIHQKFRDRGGRTLCLPFLRWMHRFERPMGTRYENKWEHRIRNYLIGFAELGRDSSAVEQHFGEFLDQATVDKVKAILELEKDSPFDFFEAIYCINQDSQSARWQVMEKQFEKLGICYRVRRFRAVQREGTAGARYTLSHRAIVEEASGQGYNNVLVFEDDTLFYEDALEHLANAVSELKHQDWQVFYLGDTDSDQCHHELDGCRYLKRPIDVTCTYAIAYHSFYYDKLLTDVPADETFDEWVKIHTTIGQYLRWTENRVVMSPVISTQEQVIGEMPE